MVARQKKFRGPLFLTFFIVLQSLEGYYPLYKLAISKIHASHMSILFHNNKDIGDKIRSPLPLPSPR
jgi:hypothetical protein